MIKVVRIENIENHSYRGSNEKIIKAGIIIIKKVIETNKSDTLLILLGIICNKAKNKKNIGTNLRISILNQAP